MWDCSRGGGGQNRCNELCESAGKLVSFQGTSQTLSFCGKENGNYGPPIKCHCMDGHDTFKHSNKKKARKKYNNERVLTQFANGLKKNGQIKSAVGRIFEGHGSSADNLAQCYEHCPGVCHRKEKLTGGCAMPHDA